MYYTGDNCHLSFSFPVFVASVGYEICLHFFLDCLSFHVWPFRSTTCISFCLPQAHILNLCVHELLVVTLYEARIVDEDLCQDVSKTEISSFLNNDTNANELFGELIV